MAGIYFHADGIARNHAHRDDALQPTSADIWIGRSDSDVWRRNLVQLFIRLEFWRDRDHAWVAAAVHGLLRLSNF